MRYLILVLLFVVGCGYAKVEKIYINKHFRCTDFRDGEVFSFHSRNVKRSGITTRGYRSITFIDDSGRERSMDSLGNSFVKCAEIEAHKKAHL